MSSHKALHRDRFSTSNTSTVLVVHVHRRFLVVGFVRTLDLVRQRDLPFRRRPRSLVIVVVNATSPFDSIDDDESVTTGCIRLDFGYRMSHCICNTISTKHHGRVTIFHQESFVPSSNNSMVVSVVFGDVDDDESGTIGRIRLEFGQRMSHCIQNTNITKHHGRESICRR
jgi:hypothetical protein